MVNFFNRTWIVASLFAATSSFAQDNTTGRQSHKNSFDGPKTCINQGHEMAKSQMNCAYSAPARIEVRGAWNINATGSYLYWQARQENLDLGLLSNSTDKASSTLASVKHPHFNYRSAFKVGLGLNTEYDNWDLLAEYTWFHGKINTAITAGPAPFAAGKSTVIFPEQGSDLANKYFYSANQSWNLKIDFIDLSLARAYYSGTKVTFRPYIGARGGLIRQKEVNSYVGSSLDTNANGQSTVKTLNRSISQGIGPRAGVDSNWLLGYGLRLIGNGSADILYTRYNVKSSQSSIVTPEIKETHEDYLRPHAAMEMGLGWGTYFDNHNWHIDVSATYGFQVFWDQNMFRNNTGGAFGQSFAPNGNLYIHGLTASAKIDF